MISLVLPVFMLMAIVAIINWNRDQGRVMQVFVAGYVTRMVMQSFLREIPFFSHGAGGDCNQYEFLAWFIAKVWDRDGITYMTATELPEISTTSLPPNLFAAVIYLNGGETTRTGCVALVAAAATLCCYNLYRLGVEMGAQPSQSLKVSALLLFSPGYFFYTADMFKDGLVAFLVIGALSSAFRLAKKFSPLQLALGAVYLYALWYVRFYLIFLALAPLAVGILGAGKRSILRPIFVVLIATIAIAAVSNSSKAVDELRSRADSTFTLATSDNVRDFNRIGGSGVSFDDGGNPFGAFHLKVAYTLFSPFPWQSGSLAMQIGKLDALVWYYLAYRCWLAMKRLWRDDRTLLLMFLIFIVPAVVAYASTISNIGLILRQRIPIIFVASLLGTLSWPVSRSTRVFTGT